MQNIVRINKVEYLISTILITKENIPLHYYEGDHKTPFYETLIIPEKAFRNGSSLDIHREKHDTLEASEIVKKHLETIKKLGEIIEEVKKTKTICILCGSNFINQVCNCKKGEY